MLYCYDSDTYKRYHESTYTHISDIIFNSEVTNRLICYEELKIQHVSLYNFENYVKNIGGCMKQKIIKIGALGLSSLMLFQGTTSNVAFAKSSNFDLRKKVIGLTGITFVSGNIDRTVTRAEFAKMLVQASSYRSVLTNTSNVSVFNDVPKENEYAAAIRIAAEQGYMTGFLGGKFKPDENVTLNDAVRGVLTLLGYKAEDFAGDANNKRMAKYAFLELNENLSSLTATSNLTVRDCINLFYNLLRTNMANGNTAYVASVFDGELNSDKEVNPLKLADNSLKGPKVVKSANSLAKAVPFDYKNANLFVDGSSVSYDRFKSLMQSSDVGLVIYYSVAAKTIWAYDENTDATNGKKAVHGTVESIYYESTSSLTPTSVTVNGETYKITSSDMQFAFSIYGSIKVNDDVTLVVDINTSESGDTTYTVVDYIAD